MLKVLTFTKRGMDGAAAAGKLDMVQYLHGKKVECSTDAMDHAAQEGHLKVVQVRREPFYISFLRRTDFFYVRANTMCRIKDFVILYPYKGQGSRRPKNNNPKYRASLSSLEDISGDGRAAYATTKGKH